MIELKDRLSLVFFSILYLLNLGRLYKTVDPVLITVRVSRYKRLKIAIKMFKIAITVKDL